MLRAVLLLSIAASANAQIIQCQDENGRVTLTDRACSDGKVLLRKMTPQERAEEQIRAAEARQRLSNLRESQSNEQPQIVGDTHGDGQECAKAKRQLDVVNSSIDSRNRESRVYAAQVKAAQACGHEVPQPPQPKERKTCSGFVNPGGAATLHCR